jgi:hypothetical protein
MIVVALHGLEARSSRREPPATGSQAPDPHALRWLLLDPRAMTNNSVFIYHIQNTAVLSKLLSG